MKSGGNDFHGGGFWSQMNDSLQSNNIDDALRARGISAGNQLKTRVDISAELGGRIVRDKLWFYGAARARTESYDVLDTYYPDGTQAVTKNDQTFQMEKVSYQANRAN